MEEQRCEWSPSERKVMGAVENYLENAPISKWILVPWRKIEPENVRDLSKVHPEVLDERRQQYFQAFSYKRETGSPRGE